jgi:hypothetical protein
MVEKPLLALPSLLISESRVLIGGRMRLMWLRRGHACLATLSLQIRYNTNELRGWQMNVPICFGRIYIQPISLFLTFFVEF